MSVTATINCSVVVNETLESGVGGSSSAVIPYNAYRILNQILNATAVTPATKVCAQQFALAAGTKTIDLTALPGANGVTQDCTGLKLQALYFQKAAGTASMTIKPGTSNGYNIGNSSSTLISIPAVATGQPNAAVLLFFPEGCPDVSGSAKNIQIDGTLTETFQIVLLLG